MKPFEVFCDTDVPGVVAVGMYHPPQDGDRNTPPVGGWVDPNTVRFEGGEQQLADFHAIHGPVSQESWADIIREETEQ